jgi:serine phosphatase RsbU (regulator of sigma subunit)
MPLLIYSDGLNEAEDRQQVQFGDDRLIEVLSHTTYKNAKEVIDKLMTEVRLHRNGAVPNDDLTMMCLKIS